MKTFIIGAVLMAATSAYSHAETKLTDGEVAKVLLTINDGEIDAANIAQDKSKNPDIKSFATMMADQHKENMQASKKIVKDNRLDTKTSELSKSLAADAKTDNKEIKKTGAGFDKAYVAEQIKMHEKALQTIDDVLLPNATNPDLKDHLTKTRVAVAEHLDHAKSLRDKLN